MPRCVEGDWFWRLPLAVILWSASATAQTVVYVDPDAPGLDDGTSWMNAFLDLQDALVGASSNTEIRVAEGVYYPTPTTDRTLSFQMLNGVEVLGGFAGFGEPEPDVRNSATYPTTLSGDLGTPSDSSDNSYHVVQAVGTDITAVLDGFEITAGNAVPPQSRGGGIWVPSGVATFRSCAITSNAASFGGGFYGVGGHFFDCRFVANRATLGGAISNPGFNVEATDCLFLNNSASTGGGAYEGCNAFAILRRCRFLGNSTPGRGGAVSVAGCDTTQFFDCEFSGNSANVGGAVEAFDDPRVMFIGCTLTGNSANISGGALYNCFSPRPILRNCILWGNSPDEVGGDSCCPDITYCDVAGSWSGTGNFDDPPQFVDADGADNEFGTEDDDLRVVSGSPCVDAGDPGDSPTGTDAGGMPRLLDGDLDLITVVDCGAREFSHVRLGVSGDPSVGSSLTVDITGTAGLQSWLLVGSAPGEVVLPPFGPLFLDLGFPWVLIPRGLIPNSLMGTIPALPVGTQAYLQAVGLALVGGNTSNLEVVTIE
jgi:hypothetical protein